jgi:hypothetical protein
MQGQGSSHMYALIWALFRYAPHITVACNHCVNTLTTSSSSLPVPCVCAGCVLPGPEHPEALGCQVADHSLKGTTLHLPQLCILVPGPPCSDSTPVFRVLRHICGWCPLSKHRPALGKSPSIHTGYPGGSHPLHIATHSMGA